ncbi:hypothetical protein SAY87_013175 [Trapa incisa]|uniref:Uncharacterized protein n=1 Tax=Trapa incisa TaxID=236973 RepID=A0AAN7KCP8_9MYRT|nr:hypothetical protein SAY87_013175 [Trapa incisa]
MGKQKSKVGVDLTGAWMPREKAEDIKQHEFFEARFILLPKQWQSWGSGEFHLLDKDV